MKYPDHLLDIDEAAQFLGVKRTWLRDKVTARQVPFTRIGRHTRFTTEHLAEIVDSGEERTAIAPTRQNVIRRRLRAVG